MKRHQYNKTLNTFAQELRNTMTKAEACLWKHVLRAKMIRGYSFRRQKVIQSYIADFACMELRLVIEADGITHLQTEVQEKDIMKDAVLAREGFTVLRFTDEEILRNIEDVKLSIERCIDSIEERNLLKEEARKDLPLPPP